MYCHTFVLASYYINLKQYVHNIAFILYCLFFKNIAVVSYCFDIIIALQSNCIYIILYYIIVLYID